jgi:aconitate hydratase
MAGPSRPQDRVALSAVKPSFERALEGMVAARPATAPPGAAQATERTNGKLGHGAVVIAAITSCTNTSNPSVMVAAGLVAKKAVERGLSTKPWVKASLAPGSQVVTEYLNDAGLSSYLDALNFNTVGYGCTTCIGNSGPLAEPISKEIRERDLIAVSVLSGNRNFEGRINPDVKANFLASPPLVVAYALAGRVDVDLANEPLGTGSDGQPVYLRDIWPSQAEIASVIERSVRSEMFENKYAEVFYGNQRWRELPVPAGTQYAWDPESTYVRNPPYFEGMEVTPPPVREILGARVLAVLGDSITTDHISPAGSIKTTSPAGEYLIEHGVKAADFNSYGARRGNHEVMVRGTFANIRLRNLLAPGTEGGVSRHLPDGELMSIFHAAELYRAEGVPLVVLAGKEYGAGSSRDWAAKGPALLGIRAVIARSYERIHRSNLIGMGILPLEFPVGQGIQSLALTGEEILSIEGLSAWVEAGKPRGTLRVTVRRADNTEASFDAVVRIDTPQEIQYFRHGGILPYVLRQLLHRA